MKYFTYFLKGSLGYLYSEKTIRGHTIRKLKGKLQGYCSNPEI